MPSAARPSFADPATTDVRPLLVAVLTPPVRRRLRLAAAAAARTGTAAHLVGGMVRDVLLGRAASDIDLVVEGEAAGPRFAGELARLLGGEVRLEPRFLTARVIDAEGEVLDVATARRERYASPAALPLVEPASLEEDLQRRDFSVNSMAVRLAARGPLRLRDPAGGLADLRRGRLRVLHPRSFVDDPTRALRAARLEVRLGLEMERGTRRALAQALESGAFERLSGERLRRALGETLSSPRRFVAAALVLRRRGLLSTLHPHLATAPGLLLRLGEAAAGAAFLAPLGLRGGEPDPLRLALLAMACALGTRRAERLGARLALPPVEGARLRAAPSSLARARAALARPRLAPHRAHAVLRALGEEELALLAGSAGVTPRGWIVRELREMRGLRLRIRGADLLARGVPSGAVVGRALARTREARLDSRIGSGEELDYALRRAAEALERAGPATSRR